jgi:hypothetical protein
MLVRTHVFRTVEDPNIEGRPEDCPFDANLFLAGRMLPLDEGDALGVALACSELSGPLVRDVVAPFYAEFRFDDGETYTGDGVARVLDADVPEAGVVQAGCTLRLVSGPPRLLGGMATSASVFDPAGALETGTGSVWTIRAYFGAA